MRKIGRLVLATGALLSACVQYEIPVQPVPPGPTREEVAEYTRAQAEYRAGQASGDDDAVERAVYTSAQISHEILYRQDPKLSEARALCDMYRVESGERSTFAPQFAKPCENIERRYKETAAAIRRDLAARIAAVDYATVAQVGHP
jgi:hypothetical protein